MLPLVESLPNDSIDTPVPIIALVCWTTSFKQLLPLMHIVGNSE